MGMVGMRCSVGSANMGADLASNPKPSPKVWTVLLSRPDYIADDSLDTFMTHVEAKDAEQAVRKAQCQAIVMDHAEEQLTRFEELREFAALHEREDYAALIVIEGKHRDVKP